MTPLIDGDVLLHEIGWSAEFPDKDTKEKVLFNFDKVQEILEKKIELICEDVDATEEPIFYFTDNPRLANKEKREFKQGFRYDVAVSKPYKGTRNNPKPFHFYNILAYLMANYDYKIAMDGLEADDLICYDQYHGENTIICSRDKDLRICPGWHFSWECGKQAAIPPTETDELGWLWLGEKPIMSGGVQRGIKKECKGYGLKFFYAQMIMGDPADNIPGLPKMGDVAAFNIVNPLETKEEVIKAVKDCYKEHEKLEDPKAYYVEQANLLWMRMDGEFKL